MPLEGQQRVVMNHPGAVVDDANHALAAGFDFDADRVGARVQGVFEQLLHDRSRPLDHFARSDAIGDCFRQYANAAHAAGISV